MRKQSGVWFTGTHPRFIRVNESLVVKKRSLIRSKQGTEFGARVSILTGEHCPVSGLWASEEDPESARFISEGSVMPAHHGLAALWVRQATEGVAAGTQ
jgi:hypothetical protein